MSAINDRFKLQAHNESREQAIDVLNIARRDGKLGDQITPAGAECLPMKPMAGAPPPPPPPQGPGVAGAPQCPSTLAFGVDKTNLTGTFDFDLQWTPDQILGSGRVLMPIVPFDANGPSLFTRFRNLPPIDVLVRQRGRRRAA